MKKPLIIASATTFLSAMLTIFLTTQGSRFSSGNLVLNLALVSILIAGFAVIYWRYAWPGRLHALWVYILQVPVFMIVAIAYVRIELGWSSPDNLLLSGWVFSLVSGVIASILAVITAVQTRSKSS
jgi:hypothetical protein